MRRLLLVPLALLATASGAAAQPSQLSWDWYRTAETQLRYVPPDPGMAVRYFRRAAEAGNDAAQYKLGEHYASGFGVGVDPRTACAWFRRSAEAGNPHAAVKLGECLQKGTGVPRDPAEAVRWYEAAIAKGNVWGRHMLGFMLADGDGVEKNEPAARDHLEASVRANDDPWAKWRLARLIRATEPERARRLFAEAARQGNLEAWLELEPAEAGLKP